MSNSDHVWALVLAAGNGSRLRALTTKPCGTAVPKQFCSLHGHRSLLEDAIVRASHIVPPERICTIVAQQHQQWWSQTPGLNSLPAKNLIVQPRNRGTGIGILYSLLHILAMDPKARVLLLPADHYVRDEGVMRQALEAALEHLERQPKKPVLLGLQPEEVDPELGYILPAQADPQLEPLAGQTVARFVEKPSYSSAAEIVRAGGLWNAFIIATSAQSLLDLFLPRYSLMVMEMQVIVKRHLRAAFPAAGWPAVVELYERLPDLDFSRDILEGNEPNLRVIKVPPCGWSDLGTPVRVGETLRRSEREPRSSDSSAYVNLAAQHAHLERRTSMSAPL
jgi:mannose-1-phosphate guanylyltransferase